MAGQTVSGGFRRDRKGSFWTLGSQREGSIRWMGFFSGFLLHIYANNFLFANRK
jgi:hypothetical protein